MNFHFLSQDTITLKYRTSLGSTWLVIDKLIAMIKHATTTTNQNKTQFQHSRPLNSLCLSLCHSLFCFFFSSASCVSSRTSRCEENFLRTSLVVDCCRCRMGDDGERATQTQLHRHRTKNKFTNERTEPKRNPPLQPIHTHSVHSLSVRQ